jgi:hypothetical protein
LTSASALIWTFAESGSTQPYVINKAVPSTVGTDNLVSPAATKRIDNQWDPLDPTTGTLGARTITFRDNLRSPLTTNNGKGPYAAGSNGVTNSGSPTVIDSRVLTMYCSDGSTVSLTNAKSFIVYTLDNGYDFASYKAHTVYQADFRSAHTGWNFTQAGGVATSSVDAAKGLCITVGSAGDNDGSWISTYPLVNLVANSVWEARMTVSTTQTSASHTPLWMLVYDNYDGTSKGQNEYGGEYFFLDNEGGGNSPITGIGRSSFKVFMMPIAMQTPQFSSSTNGFFTSTLDPNNDFRVTLRVFDIASGAYGANLDAGAVCWQDIQVVQHDLGDMVVDDVTPTMNVTSFTNAMTDTTKTNNSWYKDDDTAFGNPAVLSGWGGAVTLAPTNTWTTGEILMFRPGDQTLNLLSTTGAENSDNYPIRWLSDTLYYVEFQLSAISTTTESMPPDVIRVGADTETSELTFDNFYVPNTPDLTVFNTQINGHPNYRGLGMPRAGTPQKYACFFYTHTVSKTTIVDGTRWRPRFEILTNGTLSPQGDTTTPYGLIVNSCKVQKVHFSK